jgi:hypothetical protein
MGCFKRSGLMLLLFFAGVFVIAGCSMQDTTASSGKLISKPITSNSSVAKQALPTADANNGYCTIIVQITTKSNTIFYTNKIIKKHLKSSRNKPSEYALQDGDDTLNVDLNYPGLITSNASITGTVYFTNTTSSTESSNATDLNDPIYDDDGNIESYGITTVSYTVVTTNTAIDDSSSIELSDGAYGITMGSSYISSDGTFILYATNPTYYSYDTTNTLNFTVNDDDFSITFPNSINDFMQSNFTVSYVCSNYHLDTNGNIYIYPYWDLLYADSYSVVIEDENINIFPYIYDIYTNSVTNSNITVNIPFNVSNEGYVSPYISALYYSNGTQIYLSNEMACFPYYPSIPTPISPTNHTVFQQAMYQFNWNPSYGANTYYFIMNNVTNLIYNNSNKLNISNYAIGSSNVWYVVGKNNIGSAVAPISTFIVAPTMSAVSVAATNGYNLASWQAAPNSTNYKLYIDNKVTYTGTATNAILVLSNGSHSVYQEADYLNSLVFFGPTNTFTVADPIPSGLSFAYNSTVFPMTSTFSWTGTGCAASYTLNIISNGSIITSTNTGVNTSIVLTNLTPWNYSYCVTANYANGTITSLTNAFSIASYIYTINIGGTNVGGVTGNYPTWSILNGTNLTPVFTSSGAGPIAYNLYGSMPANGLGLTQSGLNAITNGSTFVISSVDEPSAPLTRIFSFYNQTGGLMTNICFSSESSGAMIYSGTADTNGYLSFYFNGNNVTATNLAYHGSISKIIISGNNTNIAYGLSSNPEWYTWNAVNDAPGSALVSTAIASNLITDMPITSTLSISPTNQFILLSSYGQGSYKCNRTFTFFDNAGNTNSVINFSNVDTATLEYLNASETNFAIFSFDGYAVKLIQ